MTLADPDLEGFGGEYGPGDVVYWRKTVGDGEFKIGIVQGWTSDGKLAVSDISGVSYKLDPGAVESVLPHDPTE